MGFGRLFCSSRRMCFVHGVYGFWISVLPKGFCSCVLFMEFMDFNFFWCFILHRAWFNFSSTHSRTVFLSVFCFFEISKFNLSFFFMQGGLSFKKASLIKANEMVFWGECPSDLRYFLRLHNLGDCNMLFLLVQSWL